MDQKEVLERVKEDQIKFVSFQFSDVTGSVKSVDAPVEQLEGALNRGVWFDGSSVEGFARIQESDMHLKVDIDTYAVLPWSPPELRRARFFCDIYQEDQTPFPGDPRGRLKRALKDLKEKRGWTLNVGPEPEFFLFRRQSNGNTVHPVPHDVGGYFDFSPNDEAVRVRTELMLALNRMGLQIEFGHHEVALGQHEIDFRFEDALKTADNVLTMKYTVKAIAAQNGLIASFMPKPIFGMNGSGMHCHLSVDDANGENIFFERDNKYHLSQTAFRFIEGLLYHARAVSAIVAPSVNSYKRLVPGYEAPVYIGWAQINRSALIRIPRYTPGMERATRVEVRYPDPSSNPYLAFLVMLEAALDGLESKRAVPEPLNHVNIYELDENERRERGIEDLPGSLLEALQELEKDEVIKKALGPIMYEAFMRAKMAEWEDYRIKVSDWEVARYLETA